MRTRTLLIAGASALIAAVLAAQAQVPGVNSTLDSVFTLAYDNSTMKPTYSATSAAAPATTAGDFCLLYGSATKTIKVRRVMVNGAATAVMTEPVSIIKRSTVPTDGTGVKPVVTAYDANFSAGTAVAEIFTANPTAGTIVGTLADVMVSFSNLTTGVGYGHVFEFGQLGSPVVLRGVAQSVAVNLNGITYAGGNLTCTFEWTEE